MRLGKKFAFSYAAMATFQVKTKAHFLSLGIMVTDLRGHRTDILQLPEIERFAPDERYNGIQEIFAQRAVA